MSLSDTESLSGDLFFPGLSSDEEDDFVSLHGDFNYDDTKLVDLTSNDADVLLPWSPSDLDHLLCDSSGKTGCEQDLGSEAKWSTLPGKMEQKGNCGPAEVRVKIEQPVGSYQRTMPAKPMQRPSNAMVFGSPSEVFTATHATAKPESVKTNLPFPCAHAENCKATFASQSELAQHLSSYHSLEATELRERALRQQLRGVEHNHAVLREYSNLVRKLLSNSQVKVNPTTNPFNVRGGRPKRLFRCSKSEASRKAKEQSTPASVAKTTPAPVRLKPTTTTTRRPKIRRNQRPSLSRCELDATYNHEVDEALDNPARDSEHGSLNLSFAGFGLEEGGEATWGAQFQRQREELLRGQGHAPARKLARLGEPGAKKDLFLQDKYMTPTPFMELSSAEAAW